VLHCTALHGRKMANLFTDLRGVLIILPWALYLVLMDLICSVLLPFSYPFPDGVYNITCLIAFANWKWIQGIFEILNGAVITMSGDELPRGGICDRDLESC
jgi:hypothetical protein